MTIFDELIEQWGGERAVVAALGTRHLHGRVTPAGAESMISWDGVAELLLRQRLAPPRMKVVHTAGRSINPKLYLDHDSSPRRAENPVVDIARLGKILDSGSTLVIDNVDEMVPHIGDSALALSAVVGEWAQAHLYATKGATPAFAPHWDVVDVLILQVEGEKHWDVYGPSVRHPIDAVTDPDNTCPEKPIWSGVLHPGDALYLPRGWFHGVRGTGGTSIHLSYGFQRRTGVTYLGWLAGFARHVEAFREDLPRGEDPADLERHGKLVGEALAQLVQEHPVTEYLAQHAGRVRPPVNPGLGVR
jgi:hypothetical protein